METLKLEDFLKYNYLSSVKLSSSGAYAAYLAARADVEENKYHSDLYCLAVDGQDHAGIRLTASGFVKSFAWLNETALIYAQPLENSAAPIETTELYRIELSGDAPELLCTLEGTVTLEGILDDGTVVFSRVDDLRRRSELGGLSGREGMKKAEALAEEDRMVTVLDEYPFWYNGRGIVNKTRKAVYRCAADGSGMIRLSPERFRAEHICVEGMRVAYSGCVVDVVENPRPGAYLYDGRSGETVCLLEPGTRRIHGLTLWDGKGVLVSSTGDVYGIHQCPDISVIDPKTGIWDQLCDYTAEINVGNPVGSDCRLGAGYLLKACGDWLYFISGVEDASHLRRVDRAGTFETVVAKDGSVDCFDVQNGRICMVAMHDMRLQELYQVEDGQALRITRWNDGLYRNIPPVVPEKLHFRNRDGIEIHGFVMKPAGFDAAKTYPAILDIHGGPHLSYGRVYYHEMQFWANQGYFVIYCNPRGGDGRGNEFGNLSGKFGTIDYDDIMAFCDQVLLAYPSIDAGRMGVTGGSYGGFMTNWIIGHTDRFAAAVSQRSISNFVTMENTSDIGRQFAATQVLASTHGDIQKMWDHSPLKYADTCTTPTLFIHAEQDYRCWMVEALQMYTTLIHRGVQTRLCLFHNENHELSRGGRPRSRIRRLQEITAWMDEFLKK